VGVAPIPAPTFFLLKWNRVICTALFTLCPFACLVSFPKIFDVIDLWVASQQIAIGNQGQRKVVQWALTIPGAEKVDDFP
jgi:hypothetical protein